MKQSTSNELIGKRIYINSNHAEISISRYPRLKKLANEFLEVVRKTDFLPQPEADFFLKVANEGIGWLEQAHDKAVLDEILRQGLKLKSQIVDIKESAARDLIPVRESYERLLQATQNEGRNSAGSDYLVSLEYFDIVDGEPELTEESKAKIREHYSLRIENDAEAELYEDVQLAQQAWDQVAADLRKMGAPTNVLSIGQFFSLFYFDENLNLKVDYSIFHGIRRWQSEAYKKYSK